MMCSITQSAHAYVSLSESFASGVQGNIWGYDDSALLVSKLSAQQYEIQESALLPDIGGRPVENPYSIRPPQVLSASHTNAAVSSNIDGFHLGPNNFRHTTSGGNVYDALIDLGAASVEGTLTLVASIGSSSFVNGDYGNFTRQGTTNIGFLELIFDPTDANGSNEVFSLAYGTDIGINTDLTSLMAGHEDLQNRLSTLGISIVLNEQYGVCDGVVIGGEDTCGQGVNGLHIYSSLGDANGIRLGVSYAKQTAVSGVPEASTYGMMLIGLGLVGWAVQRRKT